MKNYIALLALCLFACGEPDDSDTSTQEESADAGLGVTTAALVNGCHGYLSIKSAASGLTYSPYSTGRVWDLVRADPTMCYYTSSGWDFLYSPPQLGGCGQYSDRVWYCGATGVVSCPSTATLSRPNGASDNPFGPYTAFSSRHISYHASVTFPFTHSYFDQGTKSVVCGYKVDGKTYRYAPGSF